VKKLKEGVRVPRSLNFGDIKGIQSKMSRKMTAELLCDVYYPIIEHFTPETKEGN